MKSFKLRLYEDLLPAHCPPVFLPATPRTLYAAEGELMIDGPTDAQRLPAGSARVSQETAIISNGAGDSRVWRWELDHDQSPAMAALPAAPATRTTLKLEADVQLDERFDWLMRCDEVGFPPGGIALTHVHQGPGIRICTQGEITIETLGQRSSHRAGQAWFELGHAPVLAPTTEDEATLFVRCFLLPRALKGRSSIRYVRPEDAHSPKVQTYRVFAERDFDFPK